MTHTHTHLHNPLPPQPVISTALGNVVPKVRLERLGVHDCAALGPDDDRKDELHELVLPVRIHLLFAVHGLDWVKFGDKHPPKKKSLG